MAITNLTSPQTHTPAFNGQFFVSSSNQIAAANFAYTIVITDIITSGSQTYQIEQRPDGKVVFDASVFSRNYIRHFIPKNEYGFLVCEDATRKIRVNVGETYGSTPAYASGTNQDYIIWNGYERYLSWPTYDKDNYVYKNSEENYQYLTSYQNADTTNFYKPHYFTYSDRSQFLYVLSSEVGDLELIRINCYDESGNLIQYSDIDNPYEGSSDYQEKYVCIDIGRKGLDNISSGLISQGAYPIIPANCFYYEIVDMERVGDEPPFTYEARQVIQRLYLGCERRFTVHTLQFLDKEGNFETIHCSKVSEANVQAEKKYFRQNPYELESNVYSYDPSKPNERVYSTVGSTRIRLNSDWVTEEQCEAWQYIINSAEVYLDLGSSTNLVPVKVNTNSWRINKKWNEKMYNVTLDIEYTFKEVYQHG